MADFGPALNSSFERIAAQWPLEAPLLFRALVARLGVGAAARSPYRELAEKPFEAAVAGLERLAGYLRESAAASYKYPGDDLVKDYRLVTGLTIASGAQTVDLNARLGLKTALQAGRRHPLLAASGWGKPWLRVHTERRYLAEFNESGWDQCYERLASMLEGMPRHAGVLATSWFYDPQLDEISPRLAYLRRVPMSAGAISVAHGTTAFDVQSATATSASRRKLFEQGRYRPVSHSIIWPRDAIIAWAQARNTDRRSVVRASK